MPSRKYSLKADEPQRLEITWKGAWKNMKVLVDSQEIGQIDDMKALRAGKDFQIKEGTLRVQFVMNFMNGELRVLLDGEPLPGSSSDPAERVKLSYITLFFIAGLNLALGIAAEFFQVRFLQELGVGLFSAIFGAIFLGLGFLVMKKHSLVALWAAILLFVADGILGLFFTIEAGNEPATGGIVMRIVLLVGLFQGLKGIKQLKEKKAQV